jgi:hypothetical protein
MALTDEQRAMLQLLLEGGQGYDDIASLLGISGEEVRSRAREALREIGGADPDAQVGLSDYLLGQADPIGRADAVRHLQNDPEANALAQSVSAQLRLLAPKAQLPEIPAPRGGRRAPPPPAAPEAPARPGGPAPPPAAPAPPAAAGESFAARLSRPFKGLGSLSRRHPRIVVGAGTGALLILVGGLAVAGAFSGGGDDSAAECPTSDVTQAQQAGVPSVPLTSIGDATDGECPPTGQLTLGADQNQFALQVNASGLEPTTGDQLYVLWLYRSENEASPIGRQTVDANGNMTGGAPLTPQQLVLIPAFQTIRVSLASQSEVAQALQGAKGQGKQPLLIIPFIGQPVLEGPVADLGIEEVLQSLQQGQTAPGQSGGGGGDKGGATQ